MIKVVAFDLFGTVFNLHNTPIEEVNDYISQVNRPEWQPLTLPKSWENLLPFPDSRVGIKLLRENGFIVVTCSNAPIGLQIKLCKNSDIQFDGFIPLEINRVYKPNPKAYQSIYEILGCDPEEVLMVTGNKGSPDVEAAKSAGLQSCGIRKNERATSIDILSLSQEL